MQLILLLLLYPVSIIATDQSMNEYFKINTTSTTVGSCCHKRLRSLPENTPNDSIGEKIPSTKSSTLLHKKTSTTQSANFPQFLSDEGENPTKLPEGGVLYPRVSESRNLLSLDGFWSFVLDSRGNKSIGIREKWYEKDISNMADAMMMPVPSSYNDITTNASVRDHVGLVWYQRTFFVPTSWFSSQQRIWLRFGGVNYLANVWINGEQVLKHEIGNLPFQGEITRFVSHEIENKVTVSVDNRLGNETLPHGSLEVINTENGPKIVQKYGYGFYNYAGIHLPVYLYTTPKVYIDDISLESKFQSGKVSLLYYLLCEGIQNKDKINVSIAVIDKDGVQVGYQAQIEIDVRKITGVIEIDTPKLWWPYLMSTVPGYLYTVEIKVRSRNTEVTDVYRIPFGFRSIRWNNESIFINDKPVYIRGISKHEDSDIRGRALDLPSSIRDHNLLKWLGVNSYRTSHCPQAEESMDVAERMGFMVIDEVPSINTQNFSSNLLSKHKMAIAQLIKRDKNRACVIMWSVANEPASEERGAGQYFGSVVNFARSQDASRPITAILNRWNSVDQAGQWMDVISFNRYNGYFNEPGQLEIIKPAVEQEGRYWHERYNKPVVMSEYGTEAFEGLHDLPENMWTEEFQNKLFSEHFKAFDELRRNNWFIGEMVYCFTDFKTHESTKRVGARQKKGLFTRSRQPKSSAYLIRRRNMKLAATEMNISLPTDLEFYSVPTRKKESM